MRKIFASLFFAFSVAISFAQRKLERSDHLTFKGVPIYGTLNQFISAMNKSGFTLMGTENGITMLKGDFAAYENCILRVEALKQKDLVSKITVVFPEQYTWSYLSLNYFSLKELLTIKYGEPSESVEEFQSISQPRDDNDKMNEVKTDRCKYYTTHETDQGRIQLSIDHDGEINCFVRLSYFDKVNGAKK